MRRLRQLAFTLLLAVGITAVFAQPDGLREVRAQEAGSMEGAGTEGSGAGADEIQETEAGVGTGSIADSSAEKDGEKKQQKSVRRGKPFSVSVRCGREKVRWTSDNKKVAVVRQVRRSRTKSTAIITGKKKGTCTITAKAGGRTILTCTVQVRRKKPEPGTFKKGFYYEGRKKKYSLKKAISGAAVYTDFHGAHYLHIGASRVRCAMNYVTDPDVYFAAYGGSRIRMMFRKTQTAGGIKPEGLKVIDDFLAYDPAGTVLIDMGGNDVRNCNAYISLYRTLIRKYPKAEFWFVGLLPREDGTNAKRVKFNKKLKHAFPSRTIDLYQFALHSGIFGTVDGIHYGPELTRLVYERMMLMTGRRISVDIETGAVTPLTDDPGDAPQTDMPAGTDEPQAAEPAGPDAPQADVTGDGTEG